MQARIPLFSAPQIRLIDTAETSPYLVLLDLTGDADPKATRLLTVYAQVYRETPDGSSAQIGAFVGEVLTSLDQLVAVQVFTDSNPNPVRLLDQYVVRGDEVLSLLFTPSQPDIQCMVWGFYTVEGGSDQVTVTSNTGLGVPFEYRSVERSDKLDKRPLQPDNTVPEAATLSVEAPLDASGVAVHVVPATSPYIDEVTVDVCILGSTEARVYFEDYPDNFIFLRQVAIAPGERGSINGFQKALDGIPFRAAGTLLLSAVTAGENHAAVASGFFVRY